MEIEDRKVRSDKKREIQPTLPIDVYSCIYRLHKITGLPIKTIGEDICTMGLLDKRMMSKMSVHFRRNIDVDNTIYFGFPERAPVKRRFAGMTKRISVRFRSPIYDTFNAISYAADCTVSRACALLIDNCMNDADFVNTYVENFLMKNIDAAQIEELQNLMKVLNASGEAEVISWGRLLSFLMDDVVTSAGKIKESVNEFLINKWDK